MDFCNKKWKKNLVGFFRKNMYFDKKNHAFLFPCLGATLQLKGMQLPQMLFRISQLAIIEKILDEG